MSNAIEVTKNGDRVVVRFTRPDVRNRLSISVVKELTVIVDKIGRNASVREVVLTGTGDAFASGANLREIASLKAADAKEFALLGQTLMQKIEDLPQATTAMINGYCFGGGLDLALACDRRITTQNATFCHPGVGLGIITGWGGTQRLPRLIGEGNALKLFLTAEPIAAEEALRIGLIDGIKDAFQFETEFR